MARFRVDINPEILKWAREEAGYSIAEIAQKMKISTADYTSWESDGKGLPIGKLNKIAKYYKRQVAVFFLPETPEKLRRPKDFRNLALGRTKLSKETLFVMRRVGRYRDVALEEKGSYYWEKQYAWQRNIGDKKAEALFGFLREILEIDLGRQQAFKSPSQAYKAWRNAIEEKLGILVFQFSMPFEELQGFCYADYFPNAIVVNSRQSYTARIFTLFHELAHILKRQSGICTPDRIDDMQKTEYACNSFAGGFLIPESSVLATDDLELITNCARKLKISREVYLRRIHRAGLIQPTDFFELLDDIKKTYRTTSNKKGGFVKPTVKSRAERGETFYNMILEGVNKDSISYSDASDLLGLKLNTMLGEF